MSWNDFFAYQNAAETINSKAWVLYGTVLRLPGPCPGGCCISCQSFILLPYLPPLVGFLHILALPAHWIRKPKAGCAREERKASERVQENRADCQQVQRTSSFDSIKINLLYLFLSSHTINKYLKILHHVQHTPLLR